MNVLSVQAMSSGIYQCINNDEKPVFRRPSKSQQHWVEIHSKGELSFTFTFCFVLSIFRFWFLVTFEDEVTKIRKYYVIFVYILQGKMGKTEKNRKKITQLK